MSMFGSPSSFTFPVRLFRHQAQLLLTRRPSCSSKVQFSYQEMSSKENQPFLSGLCWFGFFSFSQQLSRYFHFLQLFRFQTYTSMKSLLCWSQWQNSHLSGSSHNFMLHILPKLQCNQDFFAAPVNSRLFADSGIPNMKIKNYKIEAILERTGRYCLSKASLFGWRIKRS